MAIDRLVPQAHRGAKGFGEQAVLAVDIGCQRGSGGLTTHVIGTLKRIDPSPSDWAEPGARWKDLVLRTGRGWETGAPMH